MLAEVLTEMQKSVILSVCIDSTPDVSHVDMLTIAVWYVTNHRFVECFLAFVEVVVGRHRSAAFAKRSSSQRRYWHFGMPDVKLTTMLLTCFIQRRLFLILGKPLNHSNLQPTRDVIIWRNAPALLKSPQIKVGSGPENENPGLNRINNYYRSHWHEQLWQLHLGLGSLPGAGEWFPEGHCLVSQSGSVGGLRNGRGSSEDIQRGHVCVWLHLLFEAGTNGVRWIGGLQSTFGVAANKTDEATAGTHKQTVQLLYLIYTEVFSRALPIAIPRSAVPKIFEPDPNLNTSRSKPQTTYVKNNDYVHDFWR